MHRHFLWKSQNNLWGTGRCVQVDDCLIAVVTGLISDTGVIFHSLGEERFWWTYSHRPAQRSTFHPYIRRWRAVLWAHNFLHTLSWFCLPPRTNHLGFQCILHWGSLVECRPFGLRKRRGKQLLSNFTEQFLWMFDFWHIKMGRTCDPVFNRSSCLVQFMYEIH